ncbi:MAG: ChaN family lipoprotein [Myxococcales bacterium]|nr:ChaN family lipoprotein [Myxococcales bacterium]
MNRSALLTFSFALPLTFGCAATQERPRTPEGLVRQARPAARVLDLRAGGERVDEATLFADLRAASVVYLGERHDNALDHSMQQRVIRALHAHEPNLVIGLEMVQRPYQAALNDWVAGRLDENALRTRIEWDQRWGHDFALYRPIFELARSREIGMVALNARAELTRAVARQGVDGLDELMREELPELDLGDEAHREAVLAAMGAGVHRGDPDHLYAAQVVWDETMAEAVAGTLRGGAPRVIVLAGEMHVRGGRGIPRRAARRGAEPYRIVIAVNADADVDAIVAERPPIADYLWVHAAP